MPDTVNLTVYVEQKRKEDVIDCLLPLTCISGFFSGAEPGSGKGEGSAAPGWEK